MNAEDAAKALFPPQDGSVPGVDRNERSRHAFVLGSQWQKDAWKADASLPEATIEALDRFAANLCEGGAFRDVRMTVEEIWDLAGSHTRALIVVEQEDKIPPPNASADSVDPDEYNPEAGSRYPEPIGTPITEDAMGRAVRETDPVAKAVTEQTLVLREILRVLKARR